jgi:hypothetical protein
MFDSAARSTRVSARTGGHSAPGYRTIRFPRRSFNTSSPVKSLVLRSMELAVDRAVEFGADVRIRARPVAEGLLGRLARSGYAPRHESNRLGGGGACGGDGGLVRVAEVGG